MKRGRVPDCEDESGGEAVEEGEVILLGHAVLGEEEGDGRRGERTQQAQQEDHRDAHHRIDWERHDDRRRGKSRQGVWVEGRGGEQHWPGSDNDPTTVGARSRIGATFQDTIRTKGLLNIVEFLIG